MPSAIGVSIFGNVKGVRCDLAAGRSVAVDHTEPLHTVKRFLTRNIRNFMSSIRYLFHSRRGSMLILHIHSTRSLRRMGGALRICPDQ